MKAIKYLTASMCLIILATGSGCTSGAVSDSSAANVTANEAAQQRNFKQAVLLDFPASEANVLKLGIRSWSFYVRDDSEFQGGILFAVDANKDVKYALVMDTKGGEVAAIEYDKEGAIPGSGITKEVYDALLIDFVSIQDELLGANQGMSTQAFADPQTCGRNVGYALIGGIILLGGGWVLTGAAITSASAVGGIGGGIGGGLAGLGGTGATIATTAVVGAYAAGKGFFTETINACKQK
jgi:hypothetical protein